MELIVASVMLPRRQDSAASMSERQADRLALLLVLMPRARSTTAGRCFAVIYRI